MQVAFSHSIGGGRPPLLYSCSQYPVLTFAIVLPIMRFAPVSLFPNAWWRQGLAILFLCPQHDAMCIIGSWEFRCRIKKKNKNMVCGFIKPNLFCDFYQIPVKSWKSWDPHSLVLWSIWNRRWKNVSMRVGIQAAWSCRTGLGLRLDSVIICRKRGSSGIASWPEETPSMPTCGLSITTWKGNSLGGEGSGSSGVTVLVFSPGWPLLAWACSLEWVPSSSCLFD